MDVVTELGWVSSVVHMLTVCYLCNNCYHTVTRSLLYCVVEGIVEEWSLFSPCRLNPLLLVGRAAMKCWRRWLPIFCPNFPRTLTQKKL